MISHMLMQLPKNYARMGGGVETRVVSPPFVRDRSLSTTLCLTACSKLHMSFGGIFGQWFGVILSLCKLWVPRSWSLEPTVGAPQRCFRGRALPVICWRLGTRGQTVRCMLLCKTWLPHARLHARTSRGGHDVSSIPLRTARERAPLCVHVYTYLSLSLYIYIYMCMIYLSIYLSLYIYNYISLSIYIYTYIHMYMYTYAYTYTYTHNYI